MKKIRWNTKKGQAKLEVNEEGKWIPYTSSSNYVEDKQFHYSGFTTFLSCREQGYEIEYTLADDVKAYIELTAKEHGYNCCLIKHQCLGLYIDNINDIVYELPYKAVLDLMSISGNYITAVDTLFESIFS